MATIITISNLAEGVGKTTTVQNLGHAFAKKKRKVLLIDLTQNTNLTCSILGDNYAPTAPSPLSMLQPECTITSMTFEKWGCHGKHSASYSLDIIPAPSAISQFIHQASSYLSFFKSYHDILSYILQQILSVRTYDFVLIDTQAYLGVSTLNALFAADFILSPVVCEAAAVSGLLSLDSACCQMSQDYHIKDKPLGVVATKFGCKEKLHKDFLKKLGSDFYDEMFSTIVPSSIQLAEAPSHRKSIFEHAPYSKGAVAYNELAEEVFLRLTSIN